MTTALVLGVLTASGTTIVSGPTMYGISVDSALLSIDMTSGKMSNLTVPNQGILESQEESALDGARSRYYTLNVDKATGKIELIVWSTAAGHRVQTVPLPFRSSALVGVGEMISGAQHPSLHGAAHECYSYSR